MIDSYCHKVGLIFGGSLLSGWVTDVSDHCPISLKGENANWGPRPFRFNNCWLQHPDFIRFVDDSWAGFEVSGSCIYSFKEKLKIKEWNVEVYGNLDLKINRLVEKLNELDAVASGRAFSSEEVEDRRSLTEDLWCCQKQKDNLMYQKSRLKWLKEGDSNSSFFHSYVNYRRRENNVVVVLSNGR